MIFLLLLLWAAPLSQSITSLKQTLQKPAVSCYFPLMFPYIQESPLYNDIIIPAHDTSSHLSLSIYRKCIWFPVSSSWSIPVAPKRNSTSLPLLPSAALLLHSYNQWLSFPFVYHWRIRQNIVLVLVLFSCHGWNGQIHCQSSHITLSNSKSCVGFYSFTTFIIVFFPADGSDIVRKKINSCI